MYNQCCNLNTNLDWILPMKLSLCLNFSNSKIRMVIPALSTHSILMSTCKTDFYAVFNFIEVIMTEDYKWVKSLYMFINAVLENRIKTRSYKDSVWDWHTQRMPGQCTDSCRKPKSQAPPLVPSGKMEVLRGCHRNKTLKKWIHFFTRNTFVTLDEEHAGTYIQNGSELCVLFRF